MTNKKSVGRHVITLANIEIMQYFLSALVILKNHKVIKSQNSLSKQRFLDTQSQSEEIYSNIQLCYLCTANLISHMRESTNSSFE